MPPIDQRTRFVLQVLEAMHAPYIWGAKGELLEAGKDKDKVRVFDCSGLVTWCFLRSGASQNWTLTHNAARLWAECEPTEVLQVGTLIFYGLPGSPSHVVVHTGGGIVVGASGGDMTTKTLALAAAQSARVRPLHSIDYKPGRLGFRELPFRVAA